MNAPNTAIRGQNLQPYIGLALSGGGARAMAFHLGCMRALRDRGILTNVRVISSVSGGSVLTACYAYQDEDFETFDRAVVELLKRGIQGSIVRHAFLSFQLPKILGTVLITGLGSMLLGAVSFTLSRLRRYLGAPTRSIEQWISSASQSLPIWGSLTTAFECALAKELFGDKTVADVSRPGLEVMINACDLRTGTAFRFGSKRSFGWRYGEVIGDPPSLAKAVAASAAFPILLPPLVEAFEFDRKGTRSRQVLALTDGGVFDNLGVTVLEPGRSHDITLTHPVTHIISLNAGAGQFEGLDTPFWWIGRVKRSFEAVYRKAQDAMYSRLHKYVETGELDGFGMVYLGQQDDKLPWSPPDLVPRDAVKDYPTDFAPISEKDLGLLTSRGEQLTGIIVDRYLADLMT
ncbi:patatin [Rhizobium sp. NLR10a]|uniref:patatin-like phospholipase family protein n=1 Tax=unclassified Rhizobium TaxID=2613769 RepID=UPI001C83129D|nr:MULTISPECIES: patatin-like phospholipase family protein [unclassified Rhizobium]MBX5213956.1 patatin [Rhizobium sp. NLR9a]MBX5218895.1 patatin [Rhizobium sp. NLR8a]MBX5275345.1 patatin [Rhizobium sp. NLR13a]MBX5281132.1 patatin [Rhizobium sp. NLR10a]MBX5295443.1 patatin [Rhizobium sp. NLR15a]